MDVLMEYEQLMQALQQAYGLNDRAQIAVAPAQRRMVNAHTFSRPQGHPGNILEGVVDALRRPGAREKFNSALMEASASARGVGQLEAQLQALQQQQEQEELAALHQQARPGVNPAEAQLRARGVEPAPRPEITDWQRFQQDPEAYAQFKGAGRGPSTTVNVGTDPQDPAAKSYFSERGKADSKALDEVYQQADVAQKLKGQLGSFADVLRGVQTGSMSNVRADMGRLASSLGLDIDPDADKLQAGRAIANQLALTVRNPESGMGMPGQVSNRDIQFLKEAMPRITNTPGGNEMIIEVFSRLSDRAIERANAASEFEKKHGRFNKAAFEREWSEYVEANSLFDDLQDQVPDEGESDPFSSLPPGFEPD